MTIAAREASKRKRLATASTTPAVNHVSEPEPGPENDDKDGDGDEEENDDMDAEEQEH